MHQNLLEPVCNPTKMGIARAMSVANVESSGAVRYPGARLDAFNDSRICEQGEIK
jgi:hypothetical protein